MAELRRSSGAGAAVSRNAPNGGAATYDDVFGGPPRFSGPFAARMGDYSEIFGGLSSSCSIPVLDLPPPLDGDRGSGLDYSEIFGCFDGWEFAVDYEELLARREGADVEVKKADVFSSNGRDPKETNSDQQATEVSETIPNGANSDIASSEKDDFSSISTHSDDGSKQFNMSYHKTSHGNIEDGLSGKTHIAQLHAVPGFTFNVETSPPYSNTRVRNHNPLNMVNHDLSSNEGLNEGISVQKEGNFFSPSSPTNTVNRRNSLETVEKQFFMERPTSENGPASLKHHSRSSSNHSTSSGEISFPDITYVSVSDISLRTRPLRVPPPSRPPPKFANNQENPKMKIHAHSKSDVDGGDLSKPIIDHPKRYDWVASRTHAPQKASRESSSFFDVEVDAGSAAAASAAAMKEAMEQAQARLKSAKESMERKRENFQGRRKLGQREGTRYKEEEEDKSVQEVKDFSKAVTENTPAKSDKKKNEFFSEERENVRRAAKVAPGGEEKEKPLVSDEQHRQTFQGNECKLSQSYKLNEKSGAWKTDAQFYKLVNNEKKFRLIKEVPDDERAEKIPKKVNMTIKENENERTSSESAYAFERNENLWDINETCEKVENARKPTCHMARMEEETQELPSMIKEAFVQEQIASKLEGIYGFHHQMKDEELMETQATYDNVEEVNKINASEDAPTCGESENKFESFDDYKLEVHECEEKESKLQTVKVVRGCGDSQELSNVACQPHKCEEKLQPYNETCVLNGNQLKDPVCLKSQGLCTQDVGEKLETAQRPSQFENFERTRGNASVECCYEEAKNTLKGSGFTSEQEESNNLNRTEELYMSVEKMLKHKIAQEDDYSEENLEKLKETGAMKREEDEKIGVEEACMQECNETKASEAKLQGQQNDKQQSASPFYFELENSEDLIVAEVNHEKNENGNIKEVHVTIDLKEKYKMFDAARDVFQTAVNRDLEDVCQATLSENKDNVLISDQHNTDFCTVVIENTTVIRKKGQRENERRMEKEHEKEQRRKLEEVKEREREREKDKLAVERATREARERAFAEARERAERIAVERVTAVARQRALIESREKAERASAEALEKSLAEKASREARLRAERVAVERATAEARERAVERAVAEKAAADARERAEKLSASSRDKMKKDNEAEEHFRERDKGDGRTRDFPHDVQFQSASSSSSAQRPLGEVESALRCKARLERHQRTSERAAKALSEKNLRDILSQREQAERNRFAESLDADVRRWSSGKEGNLRALLSTLQYILGPESGWHPVPLTEVITAAAVKKAYRKATLCVHPDKLQQRGANIQQKYICEKVFDLLKEAWNRFNSEER